MIQKLFLTDPYLQECTAKVEKIEHDKVCLDRTVLFAESGGQVSDSGNINEFQVIGTQIEGDDIVYRLNQVPDFNVSDNVTVRIDWQKRYRIMKLHSAMHLVYFLFIEKTGSTATRGALINEEKAWMNFLYPDSVSPLIQELEQKTNEIIQKNLEIVTFVDEMDKDIIWWSLSSWNQSWKVKCGGTHPRFTGEIGCVRLKRVNKGKGQERIEVTFC